MLANLLFLCDHFLLFHSSLSQFRNVWKCVVYYCMYFLYVCTAPHSTHCILLIRTVVDCRFNDITSPLLSYIILICCLQFIYGYGGMWRYMTACLAYILQYICIIISCTTYNIAQNNCCSGIFLMCTWLNSVCAQWF